MAEFDIARAEILMDGMCCATCGRSRQAHDKANLLTKPADRHQWETPQTRAARLARTRNQPALLNPTNPEEGLLL